MIYDRICYILKRAYDVKDFLPAGKSGGAVYVKYDKIYDFIIIGKMTASAMLLLALFYSIVLHKNEKEYVAASLDLF